MRRSKSAERGVRDGGSGNESLEAPISSSESDDNGSPHDERRSSRAETRSTGSFGELRL